MLVLRGRNLVVLLVLVLSVRVLSGKIGNSHVGRPLGRTIQFAKRDNGNGRREGCVLVRHRTQDHQAREEVKVKVDIRSLLTLVIVGPNWMRLT